jgi:hypothetical protein
VLFAILLVVLGATMMAIIRIFDNLGAGAMVVFVLAVVMLCVWIEGRTAVYVAGNDPFFRSNDRPQHAGAAAARPTAAAAIRHTADRSASTAIAPSRPGPVARR